MTLAKKRWNEIEVDLRLMKEMYFKGNKSMLEIARYFGFKNDSPIWRRFKEQGIVARKGGQREGFKHSAETKKKISNSLKGKKPKNFDILAKVNKGKKRKQESKLKMSLAQKGKTIPRDTREKISKALRGEKSYRWKGGITNIQRLIRCNSKYLEWRSKVFERDNYHCQNCGDKGYLEAHHIIPFNEILNNFNIKTIEDAIDCDLLWDIGNGITYCRKCHALLDKKRKIKNAII